MAPARSSIKRIKLRIAAAICAVFAIVCVVTAVSEGKPLVAGILWAVGPTILTVILIVMSLLTPPEQ